MASSSGGCGGSVQVAAPLQHGISNCREKLTQCQQQRLGGRHLEGRPMAGEQPTFKDAGFVRADRLPERIGYGALQPSIVLHWNKVGVIRPEPGQHVGMNVAVEVVHQERAEDRNVNLFGKLIEQVLEVHAGGDVPALPQDIDHFSPHPHFGVAPSSARLSDDLLEDAWEYSRIRHAVPHEAGRSSSASTTISCPRSCAACTSTPSASSRGRKAFQWVSVDTSMMPSPFAKPAPANRQTARLRKSWS